MDTNLLILLPISSKKLPLIVLASHFILFSWVGFVAPDLRICSSWSLLFITLLASTEEALLEGVISGSFYRAESGAASWLGLWVTWARLSLISWAY